MNKNFKLILFGFWIWLIPFVIAFFIFPLQESNPALFDTIMSIALAGAAVYFSARHLKGLDGNYLNAGILAGVVWMIVNIAIDLPFFVFGILSKMSLSAYLSDIGLGYMVIPIIAAGCGSLLQSKK
jgi:hypothetical protein